MLTSVLNNIYCANDAEEILEHVIGDWRNHSVFPHADTMGREPLFISIVGDNIILSEQDFKN